MKKILYFVLISQIVDYSISMKKENGLDNSQDITNNNKTDITNITNTANDSRNNLRNDLIKDVKKNGLNINNYQENSTLKSQSSDFQQMYDLYEKDSFEKKALKIRKIQKIFNNELHYSVYKEMKDSLQKKNIITASEINEIEKNYIFFNALSDLEISTIKDMPLVFHSIMYNSSELLKYQIIMKILTFNAKDEVLHYKNAVNNNESICKLYLCILDKIQPQIVDSMSQLDIVEKIIHHPAMKGISFDLIQDSTLKFLKNVCEYFSKDENETSNNINMSIFVQTLLSIKEDYISKQLGTDIYGEIKKIINHENIIYYFDYISKHRQYMKEFFPNMNIFLQNHFKNEIIEHDMAGLKNFLQYYDLLNTDIKNKAFDVILRFCTDQIMLIATRYEYNARYKSIFYRLNETLKYYEQEMQFLDKTIDSKVKIQNFSRNYDDQVKKVLNIAKKLQKADLEENGLSIETKNNEKNSSEDKKSTEESKNINNNKDNKNENENNKNNEKNDSKNYPDEDDFIEVKKPKNISAQNKKTSYDINNSKSRIFIEESNISINTEYKRQEETLCPESAKIVNSKTESFSENHNQLQNQYQNKNQDQNDDSFKHNYPVKPYDEVKNPLNIPDAIIAQKSQGESIIIDNSPELQKKEKLLQEENEFSDKKNTKDIEKNNNQDKEGFLDFIKRKL